MAASLTDFGENAILNVLRGIAASGFAPFVALFTVAPGESGGGTEVSGGSYSRQAVTFGAPSGGQIANSSIINFTTPTANWGNVVAWGIFDASSGGNLWAYCDIATQTINTGTAVNFQAGQLTIGLSHASLTNYFRDAALNIFRGVTLAAITPRAALFTAAPTQAGGGTEVSGGSYARPTVPFAAPSGGVIQNSAQVNFPTPTANWGTVVSHGLYDAASAGNLLCFAAVSPNQVINTGNADFFASGALSVTVS